MRRRFGLALLLALVSASVHALSPEEIIAVLKDPVHSTGNVADAVDEATGARGWMNSDMKPIIDTKMVGRAATALMRPVLRNDSRKYPNHHLEILDQAEPGSVLVYVMQDAPRSPRWAT
jgi:regulator of RNase E activity RraA